MQNSVYSGYTVAGLGSMQTRPIPFILPVLLLYARSRVTVRERVSKEAEMITNVVGVFTLSVCFTCVFLSSILDLDREHFF